MSLTTSGLSSIGVARSLATAQNQLATAMFRLSTALPDAEEKPPAAGDSVSLRIGRYLGGLDEQLRTLSESLAIGQSAESMIEDVRLALDELSTLVETAKDPTLDTSARVLLQNEADNVRLRLDQRVAADNIPVKEKVAEEASADKSDADSSLPAAIPPVDLTSVEGAWEAMDRLDQARNTLTMFQERVNVILERLEEAVTNLRQVTESFSTAQNLIRLREIIDRDASKAVTAHDYANKEKVLLLLNPDGA
jgi:flagellin-like hook-associated protein FlgL